MVESNKINFKDALPHSHSLDAIRNKSRKKEEVGVVGIGSEVHSSRCKVPFPWRTDTELAPVPRRVRGVDGGLLSCLTPVALKPKQVLEDGWRQMAVNKPCPWLRPQGTHILP